MQSSSLDPNDELASGNGYWFYLKENDLVGKYLYGDVPQSYNPISEAKSVLAQRENPDKTSSINTAPANRIQLLKFELEGVGALPPIEDLEYPDIPLVDNNPIDLTAIINLPSVFVPFEKGLAQVKEHDTEQGSGEELYPEGDDLDYPDLKDTDSTFHLKNNDRNYKIEIGRSTSLARNEITSTNREDKKQLSTDFNNEFEHDSGLTLMYCPPPKKNTEIPEREVRDENIRISKKEKNKISIKNTVSKEVSGETLKLSAKDAPLPAKIDRLERTMPEHLKKRNDNYLMYLFVILVLIVLSLLFYYYGTILNKPLPV